MKHKYLAKIQMEDGEIIVTSGDDLDELLAWLNEQTEGSFGELHGEIIDNATGKVLQDYHYTPPETI